MAAFVHAIRQTPIYRAERTFVVARRTYPMATNPRAPIMCRGRSRLRSDQNELPMMMKAAKTLGGTVNS